MGKTESKKVEAHVSPLKKQIVAELANDVANYRTTLVASIKGLPASQFQELKKNLREKGCKIKVARKSLILRAFDESKAEQIEQLKQVVGDSTCLIFANEDAFELGEILIENQTPAKAKAGDVALEDITVEPGPTNLSPGPAISELGAVGLKVAVEGGKLAIKEPKTLVKKGEEIDEKTANVLAKLDMMPMKIGFIPLGAYDNSEKKVYLEIKIDKKAALEELREAIKRAAGFAINVGYVVRENVGYFIARAAREFEALKALVSEKAQGKEEEQGSSQEEEGASEASAEETSNEEEKASPNSDEHSEESNSEKNPDEKNEN
ncbi:50S ribosomal protein L10 [Candidatus Pacearchaeota archaeon]|nr:MAG: 50S ribosomal protein L10 [Candidatus Pacearchaeota archaeon]